MRCWMIRMGMAVTGMCCLLACFACSAHGGDFHVSPKGDDALGDGSLARPWRTVGRGVRALAAGDTLYLHAGVYRESVALKVPGTQEKPLVIRNYQDETPILCGTRLLDHGWRAFENGAHVIWRRNIRLDHFTQGPRFWPRIVIQNPKGKELGRYLQCDPAGNRPVPPHQEETLADVDEPGEWYFDGEDGHLYVFPRNIDGAGHDANAYTFEIGDLRNGFYATKDSPAFSHTTVMGLRFFGYAGRSLAGNTCYIAAHTHPSHVAAGGAIFLSASVSGRMNPRRRLRIRDCVFEKCYKGVYLGGVDDVLVEDCRFIECCDQGLAGFVGKGHQSTNLEVAGCLFKWTYNHYPGLTGIHARCAAVKIHRTANAWVHDCVVEYAEGINGLWYDIDVFDSRFERNTVDGAGKSGIFVENGSDRILVQDNRVTRCRFGIKVGTRNARQGRENAPEDVTIARNHVIECGAGVLLESAIRPVIKHNDILHAQYSQICITEATCEWNGEGGIYIDFNNLFHKGTDRLYGWRIKGHQGANYTEAMLRREPLVAGLAHQTHLMHEAGSGRRKTDE